MGSPVDVLIVTAVPEEYAAVIAAGGQATDPPEPREPRTRFAALRCTPEEAQHLRVAILRVARVSGSFIALSVKLGIPTNTLYHAARPNGRASLALAVRLAAVAKVPVEVLLGGRLAVAPAVIGVVAEGGQHE